MLKSMRYNIFMEIIIGNGNSHPSWKERVEVCEWDYYSYCEDKWLEKKWPTEGSSTLSSMKYCWVHMQTTLTFTNSLMTLILLYSAGTVIDEHFLRRMAGKPFWHVGATKIGRANFSFVYKQVKFRNEYKERTMSMSLAVSQVMHYGTTHVLHWFSRARLLSWLFNTTNSARSKATLDTLTRYFIRMPHIDALPKCTIRRMHEAAWGQWQKNLKAHKEWMCNKKMLKICPGTCREQSKHEQLLGAHQVQLRWSSDANLTRQNSLCLPVVF